MSEFTQSHLHSLAIDTVAEYRKTIEGSGCYCRFLSWSICIRDDSVTMIVRASRKVVYSDDPAIIELTCAL